MVSKPGKLTTSEMMELGDVPDITLAGTCNYVSEVPSSGRYSARNNRRDGLRTWLIKQGFNVFEVQIDQETHGRDYDWNIDGPQEKRARKIAKLRVYQILPDAISIISHQEILADAVARRCSIVWLPGGNVFSPQGLGDRNAVKNNVKLLEQVGPVVYAHLTLYVNAGRQIRNELRAFLDEIQQTMQDLVPEYDWTDYITFYEGDEEGLRELILKTMLELD